MLCGVGFETWKKDNDYGCVVLRCCVVLVLRLGRRIMIMVVCMFWAGYCCAIFLCFAGCSCRFEFAATPPPFVLAVQVYL